jgi:DNA-binding beta-propeller fold protein YncE
MSDRFNYLELGDENTLTPAPSPAAPSPPRSEPPWRTGRLKAVELIGEPGTGAGQFALPAGLALDLWGSLYVADSQNHRVQRITPNGEVYLYGRPGTQAGQLWLPQAVAIDPTGQYLYVAEAGNHRVQCFRFTGQPHGTIRGFQMPSGVAFDEAGLLWVADTGNARVLSVNIQSGQFLAGLDRAAGLNYPIAVACGPNGALFVTDSATSDVIGFDSQGRRFLRLGEHRPLRGPRQVALDSQGRIYVTEADANRLHVFDANGNSLEAFDMPSTKLGPLKSPSGIAVGANGDLYLADTQNHRVLRLAWE